MILIAAVIGLGTAKPEEIWAKVVDAYAKAPTFSVKFTTLWKGKKAPLYTGSLNFTRDISLKFEFRDSLENCKAGYDWTKENGGSTWVTPAEFRGYNDTLSARHPYLLVNLLEKSVDPIEWKPEVKSTNIGRQAHWMITEKEGATFTINAKTWRIASFTGPELYDEERICTTNVK